MSNIETLENDAGRFWIDEEGILRCVVKPDLEQTREHALDSLRLFSRLARGEVRPVIIESDRMHALDRDARAVYSGAAAAEVFAAVAMVVCGSVVARTLVNFIIAVRKPPFPTRIFETVEEALPWARSHLSATEG
jgi:hypothetical protein